MLILNCDKSSNNLFADNRDCKMTSEKKLGTGFMECGLDERISKFKFAGRRSFMAVKIPYFCKNHFSNDNVLCAFWFQ